MVRLRQYPNFFLIKRCVVSWAITPLKLRSLFAGAFRKTRSFARSDLLIKILLVGRAAKPLPNELLPTYKLSNAYRLKPLVRKILGLTSWVLISEVAKLDSTRSRTA